MEVMEPKFANIDDVINQTFDYVVVGGGVYYYVSFVNQIIPDHPSFPQVSGCVLASRLSEKSDIRVILLEAGKGRTNDPLIDTPCGGARGYQLGNSEYDWAFQTAPQKNLNGRSMVWNRGKGLGGSSNLNQLAWTRPGPAEIDSWEKLGNAGWSYKDIIPYIQKVENFQTPPSADIVKSKLLAENQHWFGKNGPISLAYCEVLTGLDGVLRTPLGDYTGFWSCPSTMDPEKLERCTAFKGYIQPNLDRKNLFVLPEAYVTKLIWKNDSKPDANEEITAEGVQFVFGGKIFMIHAAKEVLLTAGIIRSALKSPQILELSGIGSSNVLNPLGIPVLVDLPGVGENLQDHYCANTITFELDPTGPHRTLDVLFDPVEYEKQDGFYKQKQRGLLSYTNTDVLFPSLQLISPNAENIIALHEKVLANLITTMDADSDMFKGLKERLDIQLERLKDHNFPHFAIFFIPSFMDFPNMPIPDKMYLSVLIILAGTWSIGSAHISSMDPLKSPNLDGNVLEYQIELDALTEVFKFARQLKDCEPLKSIIIKEVAPGEKILTDEQIHGRVSDTSGTASMLPREKRGVVDPSLRNYKRSSMRSFDFSVARKCTF
ncbi:hypothetical protein Clacol_003281 [Clathrus columnatus]|uniref:Glucose-methanol-choline oxidoreductase N-terminal domain-containing protein n=1 Tax=Clathrus columnatus TaxID=1419009 RepID=A0AAV5A317_9AGAM|nr:hypothetical protein Clacol_003281 [Clathrus columnatus]